MYQDEWSLLFFCNEGDDSAMVGVLIFSLLRLFAHVYTNRLDGEIM